MNPAINAVPGDVVPPHVRADVSRTLGRLAEQHRYLTDVVRARSHGHILSLAVQERLPAIDAARARLALFHSLAAGKSVDSAAFVRELGGEPDFTSFGVPAYVAQSSSSTS